MVNNWIFTIVVELEVSYELDILVDWRLLQVHVSPRQVTTELHMRLTWRRRRRRGEEEEEEGEEERVGGGGGGEGRRKGVAQEEDREEQEENEDSHQNMEALLIFCAVT